ncbi:MAG: hypothetical protein Q4G43_08925 [Mobilicoccus sp.]|nr:hypothetical protein [Mobilicoccus sp.]
MGAALVAAPTLLVGLALLGEAQGSEVGGVLGGLTAFLVMGAVAGFAVSGST